MAAKEKDSISSLLALKINKVAPIYPSLSQVYDNRPRWMQSKPSIISKTTAWQIIRRHIQQWRVSRNLWPCQYHDTKISRSLCEYVLTMLAFTCSDWSTLYNSRLKEGLGSGTIPFRFLAPHSFSSRLLKFKEKLEEFPHWVTYETTRSGQTNFEGYECKKLKTIVSTIMNQFQWQFQRLCQIISSLALWCSLYFFL